MSILFYVICFVVYVGLNFHSSISVILTLLIVILLILLCRIFRVPWILSVKSSSDISRNNYKKLRLNMSHAERNLKTPERNKSGLGIGLFSNYDSRLGGSRSSLKSNTSISENFSTRSPNRNNYKVTKPQSDENFVSKQAISSADNEMPSPIRSGTSPFRSTPLSYSKRFNLNPLSSLHNSPRGISQSRFSVLETNSSSKSQQSQESSIRSLNHDERSPSSFSGRMITVANQMDNDQFPWIAYNGSIPMILSNSHKASSPATKISSPSSDANSSFRNRVRVRLSKPNKSESSASNSTNENPSVLDESSTTKSVIQVLKEIARKRSLVPEEEEEEEGQPLPKRRTEHNLYLSRLEGEEEEQAPLAKLRLNGEDERMKRTREPDWDSSTVSNPKRPRKSYNFVNNEIISSLSSSIGLQAFKHSHRKKSTRKSIAIQVQTLVPQGNVEEKKEQMEKSSQLSKTPPKTRDAGVETDPLPEPRPRSPVKEKVVSDVKGILKSALKKFDIQPSGSATIGSESMVTSPINSIPPSLSDVSSKVSLSVSTSANLPASCSLTTSKSTLESVTTKSNTFTTSMPSSHINFGMSSSLPEKSELATCNENKKELPKATGENLGFKLENKDVSKTESPFKFGVSANVNIEPSTSQPQVTSSSPFNFKIPDSSVSTQAPLPLSSSSVFTFGTPKTSDASDKSKTEETKSVFGNTLTTSATSSIAPLTSVVQSQQQSLTAVTTINSSEPKSESSKSVFTFQSKKSEAPKSISGDKKETVSSSIFNFEKPENKITTASSKPDAKPFQFGSGGFTFGQADNKGSNGDSSQTISQAISTTTSTTTSTTMQHIFSFSASTAKKDVSAGGFNFNAPVTTSNDQKSLFNFNSVSGFSPTSTKSTFPTSLFGNNSENNNTSSGNSAQVNNAQTSSANSMNTTFGNATSKSAPTFGQSSVTSTAPTFGSTINSTAPTFGGTVTSTAPTFGGTVTSTAPTFGGTVTSTAPTFGGTVPSTAPTFGGTLTSTVPTFGNTVTSTTSIFGSSVTSTAPTFGSTEAPKTVFGSGTNQPSFGNPVSNTSVFGSNSANDSNKPSVFGSNSTIASPPAFGISSASATVPTFGSVAAGNSNNNNPPAFGSSSGAAQPTFGSSATGISSNPSFGSTTTVSNVPAFGSGTGSAFGSTTGGSTFSSGTTASGTNPSPFGASSAGSSAPGFSGTNNVPSFGGTSAFGSTPSVSAFGSSTSTFGSSTTATPAFGNQAQPSFGGQPGTSFGNSSTFGQTSSTPSFGAQNTTFSTQNTTTPAFGSTPAFGNSSTNTFGSTSAPGTTPGFGNTSTPAFGSSTGFGNQDANKPFTFNAPASQPAQTGTFNFTAPQPLQSSGGLFQFGAGSTGASSNQPFQFNASQSSTSVGGTGQQMFSIGSGSTAPRRMTGRRKK